MFRSFQTPRHHTIQTAAMHWRKEARVCLRRSNNQLISFRLQCEKKASWTLAGFEAGRANNILICKKKPTGSFLEFSKFYESQRASWGSSLCKTKVMRSARFLELLVAFMILQLPRVGTSASKHLWLARNGRGIRVLANVTSKLIAVGRFQAIVSNLKESINNNIAATKRIYVRYPEAHIGVVVQRPRSKIALNLHTTWKNHEKEVDLFGAQKPWSIVTLRAVDLANHNKY